MVEIIKIVLPSEAETETPVAKSSTDMSSGSGGTGSGDGALSARDVVRGAKKLMAYTGIKQIADSYISFEVSNVNLKTARPSFSNGYSSYTMKVRKPRVLLERLLWDLSWEVRRGRALLLRG